MAVLNALDEAFRHLSCAPSTSMLTATVIAAFIFCVALHRLCWSKLAGFPGPRLAALTGWYETYYELVHNGGGHFTFHMRDLHAQYGS